jgi:hypothetical protein
MIVTNQKTVRARVARGEVEQCMAANPLANAPAASQPKRQA